MVRERIVNNYIAIHYILILIRFNQTISVSGEVVSSFSNFGDDYKFEIIK